METSKEIHDLQTDSKTSSTQGRPVDKDSEHGDILNTIDPVAEKKLVRKLDINIITLFGALYLMSFLGNQLVYSIDSP